MKPAAPPGATGGLSASENPQQASLAKAAYFDVDGTLTATTIVTPLIWIKGKWSPWASKLWLASLLLRGPWWLLLDRFNRAASNRAIYTSYGGMEAAQARLLAERCFQSCLKARLFPQALERLQELKNVNTRIVLVTGGLDFVMQPLAAELGAKLIAPALEERDGVFTGKLKGLPLAGETKAEVVRAHAAEYGIDLSASYAYGDSIADLAMLECVGHPAAINADSRLSRIAAERGWRSERWTLR